MGGGGWWIGICYFEILSLAVKQLMKNSGINLVWKASQNMVSDTK